MARELTKLHEEVARGALGQLAQAITERETLKGEVVLLVGPPVARGSSDIPAEEVDEAAVAARVTAVMSEGAPRTAAVKQVAKELGLSRQSVYDIALRG
jgi:16S rRNA (cytidine1402-2'-O)-methyltransferase